MFRALGNRNYRMFFIGQAISLIGTWMQRIALGWIVYRMTDSEFLLGLVAFIGQVPATVVTPVAGAIADRFDKRTLLIWTQVLEGVQAGILAALTLMGVLQVWHIVLLSLMLGTLFAVESPTRQAYVVDLTGQEYLPNAIALNSSAFNVARLIGPALAGFLVAKTGEGLVFVFNSLSYIAVIAGLLLIRLPKKKIEKDGESVLMRIREGLIYVNENAAIKFLILTLALVTLAGSVYVVLLPVFARQMLGGGAQTFGMLMAANGAGAFSGAIILTMYRKVEGYPKSMALFTLMFAGGLILFAFSKNFYFSMAMLFFTGIGYMHNVAGTNTILQTLVEDKMRGRVMSLFVLSFLGVMPFGNLIAGYSASKIGTAETVFISGIFVMIFSILYFTKISKLTQMIKDAKTLSKTPPLECTEDLANPRPY